MLEEIAILPASKELHICNLKVGPEMAQIPLIT